ncbi:MAG: site-specific integrase [Planctomycetota bacterium]|nr:site-specific integrase [Planctomycetota bacterium]
MTTSLRTLLDVLDARTEAMRADHTLAPQAVPRAVCLRGRIAPLIGIPVDEVTRARVLVLRDAIAQLEASPGGRSSGRPISARTVNSYLAALRAAWRWAWARELVPHDWPRVDALPRGPRRKRPYTDDEVRRLAAWIEARAPQWGPLLHLLAATGRRVGALVRLRGRDVDREAATITVRDKGRRGHGADVALVPVPRATLALLPVVEPDAYLFPARTRRGHTGHVYSGSLLHAVRRGLRELGIPDQERLDLHSLRRAFCSAAERAGVPVDVGRRVTGHATRQMWEHYQAESVGDDLHEVVERVRARRFGGAAPADLQRRVVAAACAYAEDLDDPDASATSRSPPCARRSRRCAAPRATWRAAPGTRRARRPRAPGGSAARRRAGSRSGGRRPRPGRSARARPPRRAGGRPRGSPGRRGGARGPALVVGRPPRRAPGAAGLVVRRRRAAPGRRRPGPRAAPAETWRSASIASMTASTSSRSVATRGKARSRARSAPCSIPSTVRRSACSGARERRSVARVTRPPGWRARCRGSTRVAAGVG